MHSNLFELSIRFFLLKMVVKILKYKMAYVNKLIIDTRIIVKISKYQVLERSCIVGILLEKSFYSRTLHLLVVNWFANASYKTMNLNCTMSTKIRNVLRDITIV